MKRTLAIASAAALALWAAFAAAQSDKFVTLSAKQPTSSPADKVEEMHSDFFNEFHQKGNLLDTEEKLAEFFGRYGVSEEEFKDVFNSFAVETKVRRAGELIKLYQIGETPGLIINGRYKPNLDAIATYGDLVEAMSEKAAAENGGA